MKRLRSKRKNRRFRRDHVLDVKVRSRSVRAARLRLAALFLTACLAVCLLAFGLWRGGEWLADKLVFKNEAFALREVQIQTDGRIAVEHLWRWAMVRQGENLLALDLARVKRDLEMVPAIRSATVDRILPGTLRIRVSEREPVAQVLTLRLRPDGGYENQVYHVDQEGYVMLPLDPRLQSRAPAFPYENLPILSGLDPREPSPGRQIESPQVHAAIQFIAEFKMSPMFGLVDVQRIEVGRQDVLTAHTDQGSEITFAPGRYEVQLRRWWIVHDHTVRIGKVITHLDLSISNYNPVRWSDPGPFTPSDPQPRNRRRNV